MSENVLKGKIIVIDPGHGGEDPGTKAFGITEKDAAFTTSLTLKYLLIQKGAKVYLTRYGDYRPAYHERTNLARKVGADAFISIHYDYPLGHTMVYWAAEKRRRGPSKRLAEEIAKQLGTDIIRPSTSSRFGRLYIDDTPVHVATVLVEVDKIQNYIPSRRWRIRKANQIIAGLENFYKNYQFWGGKNA